MSTSQTAMCRCQKLEEKPKTNHCEKFLPGILDHKIPPERFYKESPFLFWSIVSVGARRLEDNPGLLEQVTGHIIGLAVSSLYSMSNPIPAIIAVLLLCMWPLPVNTTTKDTSHALAGAAMQLALQHGLHIFGHDQDFYREPPNCRSNDKIWRARLWILCVTVVQRIQTDAIATISRNLELAGSADESSLDAFINVFDAQVVNAVMKEDKACNRLVQLHARLSIRAFHFFLESEALKKPGTLQVFTIACQLIDIHTSLDALQNWTSWTPHYFARMMLLAAYCILRIVKSELRSCINAKRGEEMFFQAVNLTKNRSTQVNDLDSRNALILRQLWTSHRAFTKRDGTLNGLHLHLKSRLVMSVVFDCFWWWRAEFAGQNFPYAEKDDDQAIEPASAHEATSPAPPESTEGQVNSAELQLLDFDLQFSAEELGTFPDWEWAAGFELPGDLDVSMLDTADLMSTV
ncbi:MAG: hypothetical protein M1820_004587 [Bogoriella megaspora]|nr:MAG: hypothetical protein M1820_004587 [Bogoriella megaspora]